MGSMPLLFASLLCVSCGGTGRQPVVESGDTLRAYVVPQPPAMIADPASRAAYMVENYWKAFDFRDTTWLADTASLEQVFANYIGVLGYAPRETAAVSLHDMLRRAEAEERMYRRLAELSEHYLYDPNSPMRNDELFVPVLDVLVASTVLDSLERIRPAYQREMIGKNRVGTVAADIRYETPDGRTGLLSRLHTPYVILFFHDPDCGMCRKVTALLDASPLLRQMIDEGRLTILTIYPDQDEQAWRAHAAEMPQKGWVHGWDRTQALSEGDVYDMRAQPTLYLLDSKKRVLLKDVSRTGQIEEWLAQHADDR